MSSSWAVQRKDDGKYYRGGWLWRWTRFACFAARYANPSATMQFFIPLLEKQGVKAQVVWLRSKVMERELDRYRRNLQDEQRRIGRGGAFITGQIAAAIAGGSIVVPDEVLSSMTAISLAGAGEDGFDRHIAPPRFALAMSEEWKAVEDHTGMTTVGPDKDHVFRLSQIGPLKASNPEPVRVVATETSSPARASTGPAPTTAP